MLPVQLREIAFDLTKPLLGLEVKRAVHRALGSNVRNGVQCIEAFCIFTQIC